MPVVPLLISGCTSTVALVVEWRRCGKGRGCTDRSWGGRRIALVSPRRCRIITPFVIVIRVRRHEAASRAFLKPLPLFASLQTPLMGISTILALRCDLCRCVPLPIPDKISLPAGHAARQFLGIPPEGLRVACARI